MRKLITAFSAAIIIVIASALTVFAADNPNRMSITWTFTVHAEPDSQARPIATFLPQNVNIVQHDQGDGWIQISTYHGEVWTNIIRPLTGRTIILDAGHGLGSDNVFMGYSEQATMLRLAHMIRPLLTEQGATVFMTRDTQTNVALPVRAARINLFALETLCQSSPYYETTEIDRLMGIMQKIIADYEAYAPTYFNFPFDWSFQRPIHPDLQRIFELQANPIIRDNFLMISLHTNATRLPINPNIDGADIYRMTNDLDRSENYFANYAGVNRTYLFADMLLYGIHDIGINRNEIKPGNWFVIREHNLPGVLVENGFHTSHRDRALLSSDQFLQRLALVYRDAILQYFEAITEGGI